MKGFPKTLNTKYDYEYVRQHFPAEEWKPAWQRLLDERKNWFPTGQIESKEAGVTDETHKVDEYENGEGVMVYTQLELMDDPNCRLVRLGFTVEEVERALLAS